MRPESFLENNLETSRIFCSDRLDDSFIFKSVHRTGRIQHLSADFECCESSFKKLRLNFCDIFYIFEAPEFESVE